MDGLKSRKAKENFNIPVIMIAGIGDKEAVLKAGSTTGNFFILVNALRMEA